jgi:antitoxin YefM
MQPMKFDQDIRPLSEFRAGVASFVKQVTETGRPLVLTQRGRGVAVVLDVHEFEAMRERLALLEDIARAEAQLARGEGVPHEQAKARILKRIDACR